MAIKIVAIICGVSWALCLIPAVAFDVCQSGTPAICGVSIGAGLVAIISTVALAVMALINYARRPREGGSK